MLTDRQTRALRLLLLAVMFGCMGYFVVFTWHWALLCDSPIMHYVVFLMSKGLKPYAQISDINYPGAYLTEIFAMKVFGWGDFGWRLYEYTTLLLLTVSMVVIARPYDWAAGVYAAGLFILIHGGEGPWRSMERDELLASLLMLAYAALFVAVRRRVPWAMAVMGFAAATAGSVKPTVVPLALLILIVALVVLRRQGIKVWSYLLYALGAMALVVALNVGYLWEHHAFRSFFFTERLITGYYTSMKYLSAWDLVRQVMPLRLGILMVPALALAAVRRREWDWERWLLVAGALVGLGSYLLQDKGFNYHRYTLEVFLALLIALEVLPALRKAGWPRWVGAATVGLTLLMYVPHYVALTWAQVPGSDLTTTLEGDLQQLGGTAGLQGQVQCLDLVYGCLNSLYHLRLMENTGFTGDMLIFAPTDGAAVQLHRAEWAADAERDPANVIVMTNQFFQRTGAGQNDFGKVNNWPAYAAFLQANYTEVIERIFPCESEKSTFPDKNYWHAYRIYVRNASGLLPLAEQRLKPKNVCNVGVGIG